ncbi:replicative helicase loader/inhibitor [Paenibacillus solisilvae]|uniref:Replicative helicase loader/inhibitor n=1 Tax=Paenibacillus solisilvae TaxID=2486751 RepID=A0ABW0VQB0_9BACL
MRKADVWKLFGQILQYYPSFSGNEQKVDAWFELLNDIPFETAMTNLKRYAASVANWPPTVADLNKRLEPVKDSITVYHDQLRSGAGQHMNNLKRSKGAAAPPQDSVRERMRGIAERIAARRNQ